MHKFHANNMVKTKGVTLVALATLLAGFVPSCSSDEAPALTSSPIALDRAVATVAPAPSSDLAPSSTPTSSATPNSAPAATATTRPEPTPVPEVVIYDLRPDAGNYSGPTLIAVDWELPNGAAIYYTLDGSTPDKLSGTLYKGEFEIYDDAQVMALVILESGGGGVR